MPFFGKHLLCTSDHSVRKLLVKPNFRKSNVAKELFNVCESWALQNSCTEMGSNTWLDNLESQKFHEKLGFQEDDRIVHYIKKID